MNSTKSSLLVVILILISAFKLYAQTKAIKGRVVGEDYETILHASIMINDTVKVGQTDVGGYFNIEIPNGVKNLSIFDVGFEKAVIHLDENCYTVDVIMMAMYTYDFKTLKKVDKLRMKRFKQLPVIHKLAFEKGMFTTDKACYRQEFIPNYSRN